MANCVEYIKVGTGESWPVRDPDAQAKLDKIVDLVYPVGSIYMSANSVSPADLFGGTWVQLKDRFLLAAGDAYSVGSTGGEASHTLTVDEMPAHDHEMRIDTVRYRATWSGTIDISNGSTSGVYISKSDSTNIGTNTVGGGQPHNNMPPYLAVYMWQRTE